MLNPDTANRKGKTFFPYGGTCFLSLVWAYFRLPEMKGRMYEELDIHFWKIIRARRFANTYVNAYGEDEVVEGNQHGNRSRYSMMHANLMVLLGYFRL